MQGCIQSSDWGRSKEKKCQIKCDKPSLEAFGLAVTMPMPMTLFDYEAMCTFIRTIYSSRSRPIVYNHNSILFIFFYLFFFFWGGGGVDTSSSSLALGILPNVPQGTNRAGVVRRCYWCREKKNQFWLLCLKLMRWLSFMVMSCSFEGLKLKASLSVSDSDCIAHHRATV